MYLPTGVLVRPLDGAGLPVGPVHRVPEHRQGVGLRTLLHHRLHDRSATAASANTRRLQEVALTSFLHSWLECIIYIALIRLSLIVQKNAIYLCHLFGIFEKLFTSGGSFPFIHFVVQIGRDILPHSNCCAPLSVPIEPLQWM